MDARQAATQLCYARIAFGLGLMLAPRQMAKGWSGSDAVRYGGRVLAVALGARDLALGLGTLRARPTARPSACGRRARSVSRRRRARGSRSWSASAPRSRARWPARGPAT